MPPMRVVPAFDPLKYRQPGLGLCLECPAIQHFAFQCREKAFGHGVVEGVDQEEVPSRDPPRPEADRGGGGGERRHADTERAQPVAMAFAKAVTLIGASGAGQLAKMVNQLCIAGLMQGLSAGIHFGQSAGLDMKLVLQVIGKGAAQSWQLDNRGATMIDDKFDFGFAVDWMRKDLGLCLDEARRNGAALPVAALVDQFYADIQAMGGNRWDTSSLIRRLRPRQ